MQMLRKLSTKLIIFVPLLFSLIFIFISFFQYYQQLERDTMQEYDRIESALDRTAKILAAVTYTISTDYLAPESIEANSQVEHQISQSNGMCWFTPVLNTQKPQDMPDGLLVSTVDEQDIDYQVVAMKNDCQPGSHVYQKILDKIILAPIFPKLNEVDPFPTGLFFVSKFDYALISPKNLGVQLRAKDFDVIKTRDFWKRAEEGERKILFYGPYTDTVTGNPVVTFSVGLFNNNQFLGVSFVDIQLNEMLKGKTDAWPYIDLVNLTREPLDQDARFVKKIMIPGMDIDQVLVSRLNVKNAAYAYAKNYQDILIFGLGLWIIGSILLFLVKAWLDKRHFVELSMRDPMTGLLNRRGLSAHYEERQALKYEGVAIFDIDDFKQINDTYGHDIGDEAICYVAMKLDKNTRQTDIVARFGGEEFVVYITAKTSEQILQAVKRMQERIGEHSTQVRDLNFTISCGLSIHLSSDRTNLDQMVKEADLKLYEAKNNGKNQVAV